MAVPGMMMRERPIRGMRESRPTWRERFQAARYIPRLLRMVWETHRGLTLAMGVLRLIRGVVPVATLWVGKLIIDGVLAAQDGGADWRAVFPLVVLEVGIVLFGELLSRLSGLVDGLLADLFTIRVSVRLMEHAASLDLAKFEAFRAS